jgi:hypothetical protein
MPKGIGRRPPVRLVPLLLAASGPRGVCSTDLRVGWAELGKAMSNTDAATTLHRALRRGWIERFDGTGTYGKPFRYRLTDVGRAKLDELCAQWGWMEMLAPVDLQTAWRVLAGPTTPKHSPNPTTERR